ncbi:MAG: hypothetical protein R2854_07470 [Caldilineaceae bacterium]
MHGARGCPGGAPRRAANRSAATTISFLTQGGNDNDFLRYEPLIENFQGANADITVEPIWEPGGAIQVQTKLLTLIAAGGAPDVYWVASPTAARPTQHPDGSDRYDRER